MTSGGLALVPALSGRAPNGKLPILAGSFRTNSQTTGSATTTTTEITVGERVPETVVIDPRGRVAAVKRGPVDEAFMRREVAPLVEGS